MKNNFASVSIEDVASYWNRQPCNIKHSSKPFNSLEYFDEVEKKKHFVEPHILEFADFPSVKGLDVLEIGCGLGTATLGFARALAKKVSAIDLSLESLKLARTRADLYGCKNIEFFQGNAEHLSSFLSPSQYDLIYSFGVIHHSPRPDKILKELHSYLKPQGKLKIMVYNKYSWKVLSIILRYGKGRFWRASEIVARYSEAQTGCPITYTYSKQEAKALFENTGFKIIKMSIDHIFPYKIADYKQHKYVKVWHFRFLPKSLFRLLERTLGWHLCIEAVKQ